MKTFDGCNQCLIMSKICLTPWHAFWFNGVSEFGYIQYSDASKLTKHHHETFRLGGMHICLDVRSNRILDECSVIFEKLVPIIWHKTTLSLMESCFVSVYFVRYWRTGSYNPTCTRPPHLCLGFNPLIRGGTDLSDQSFQLLHSDSFSGGATWFIVIQR